jgi:hypothetical protein
MVDNVERFESCAVCKRTILRGERVREYVTPAGEHERVCELCRARAEAAGWLPAERVSAEGHPDARRGRGLGLRERLARATERLRQPPPATRETGSPRPSRHVPGQRPGAAAAGRGQREPRGEAAAKRRAPAKRPVAKRQDPPVRGTGARRQTGTARPAPAKRSAAAQRQPAPKPAQRKPRAAPETPERRMRRAVERFNRSEHARVVAGLVRSLGEPRAAVRNLTGRPYRVTITVAWELSWYRWEIGLNGEQPAIREVDKGKELAELDEKERRWNASVDRNGRVRLELAAARRSGARDA